MTIITILPEKDNRYRALARGKHAAGHTVGEALDALKSKLTNEGGSTLVIVQNYEPDQFFNATQQERLIELMRLREAGNLTAEEERELESLVEAELIGARGRAEFMVDTAGRAHGLSLKELSRLINQLLQIHSEDADSNPKAGLKPSSLSGRPDFD